MAKTTLHSLLNFMLSFVFWFRVVVNVIEMNILEKLLSFIVIFYSQSFLIPIVSVGGGVTCTFRRNDNKKE